MADFFHLDGSECRTEFVPDSEATVELHRRMAELDPQVRDTVKRATRLLADKYEGALRRLARS